MSPLRRLLGVCLLLMCAHDAHAQGIVTIKQAERAIRDAQDRMYDLYADARSTPVDGPTCYVSEFNDCFRGDRECIRCVWENGPRELALSFDRMALTIMRAPQGVDVELLDWYYGQRVGLWARLGAYGFAERAATECRGSLAWCEALRAFVEHLQGSYEQSEKRFRHALLLMRAGQACYWKELTFYQDTMAGDTGRTGSIGFDAYGRHRFNPKPDRRRPCPTDEAIDAFWLIADPLFTLPGNDRMTEHYARHVDLRIHEQHLEIFREYHIVQHHTLVLRYGWPNGFDVGRVPLRTIPIEVGRRSSPSIRGGGGIPAESWRGAVFGGKGQKFTLALSPAAALTAPQEAFNLAHGRLFEEYLPAYGNVVAIPLQTGFFRRDGETLLLVRTMFPSADTLGRARWATRSWDGKIWRDADVVSSGDTLTSWLATPWVPQIISLEGLHARGGIRARTGNRPPERTGSAAISSLILIDAASEPRTLDEAAAVMLPHITLRASQRVKGYWELYVPTERRGAIEVSIDRVQTGLLNRLGLLRQPGRAVTFHDVFTPAGGVVRRAMELDVGALEPGTWEVVLTIRLDSNETVRSVARVVIEEGG